MALMMTNQSSPGLAAILSDDNNPLEEDECPSQISEGKGTHNSHEDKQNT